MTKIEPYKAEGEYRRQASFIIVILMGQANRHLGNNDIRDGIPMLHVPLWGFDFQFIWEQTLAHERIKVGEGVSFATNGWCATYRTTRRNFSPFIVTGDTAGFERDMLMVKIKRAD